MSRLFAPDVRNFNPLAPHGARPCTLRVSAITHLNFNPLAPHGARRDELIAACDSKRFQSTRPARGETRRRSEPQMRINISIHSPRTGRDLRRRLVQQVQTDFNPLAPHGARPMKPINNWNKIKISIHSPRTGRDRYRRSRKGGAGYFNPLAPHGARRRRSADYARMERISIHSPRTGRDDLHPVSPFWSENFNPLAPHGARRRLPR